MLTILQYSAISTHMKQYGLNESYYNEEMSSVKTLDLLPRYIYMSYSKASPLVDQASNQFEIIRLRQTPVRRTIFKRDLNKSARSMNFRSTCVRWL